MNAHAIAGLLNIPGDDTANGSQTDKTNRCHFNSSVQLVCPFFAIFDFPPLSKGGLKIPSPYLQRKSEIERHPWQSFQSIARGHLIDETVLIELVDHTAIDQILDLHASDFRIERDHQAADVAHSNEQGNRTALDTAQIILIALVCDHRVADLKAPHHGFDHQRFVGWRRAVGEAFDQSHKELLGDLRALLQKLWRNDDRLVEHGNL